MCAWVHIIFYAESAMYALIDCNSFYANCEKLFRPDLKDKPVVVLSNNDGCVFFYFFNISTLDLEKTKIHLPILKNFCR